MHSFDGGAIGLLVEFGPFRFNLSTLELTKFGVKLRLEEKPARVLICLVERRGTLVSREALRSSLWDQGIHTDFNHGLNKAVNKLRAVLRDSSTAPKYLETLSRRGYRFIAPVSIVPEAPVLGGDLSLAYSVAPVTSDSRSGAVS